MRAALPGPPELDAMVDYAPEHAQALTQMWRASFEHGVGIVDPHPVKEQRHFLETQLVRTTRVRVVLRGGTQVVAFMASTPDSVAQLYVRVQTIGQGLGARLLEVAKAESTGSLWLYTFAQNAPARRFYERHGFCEIERESPSENMFRLEAVKYRWLRST